MKKGGREVEKEEGKKERQAGKEGRAQQSEHIQFLLTPELQRASPGVL